MTLRYRYFGPIFPRRWGRDYSSNMDKSAIYILRLLFCMAMMAAPGLSNADDNISREYKIKAAYIYNLIKFVNWPTKMDASTDICIYGLNPFNSHLEKLEARKAKGRSINILYVDSNQPLSGCDVLFISQQNENLPSEEELAKNTALLTVGESKSFTTNGGIIGLVLEGNNILLEINLTKAKLDGFEISGNLLEIAKEIK